MRSSAAQTHWLGGAVLVVMVGTLGACIGSGTTPCGKLVCPDGWECSRAHEQCIRSIQRAICPDNGLADGDRCEVEGTSGFHCDQGICIKGECGDGIHDADEECDDGTATQNQERDPNRCRPGCRLPRCGDGVIDDGFGEECDDGEANSDSAADACRTNCRRAHCGDGVVDQGEVCDDGNFASGDGCSPECLSIETCGNGFVDVVNGEACDEGAANSDLPDAPCRANCQIPRCGDGIIDTLAGEDCDTVAPTDIDCTDLGYYQGTPSCSPTCRYDATGCQETCGDAAINGTETCDGSRLPDQSCVDYGFDGGHLTCAAWCQVTFGDCAQRNWQGMTLPNPYYTIHGIWSAGPRDTFAVGRNTTTPTASILRSDGLTWRSLTAPAPEYRAVWGTSASDVFAVGPGAAIAHFDGVSWSVQAAPAGVTASLYGVWGSSPSDVFAVGDGGTILHFDGGSWTEMSVPVAHATRSWRGVWGSGPSDVYVVGNTETILRYDGNVWSEEITGGSPQLFGIWGSGADDIFAVGGGGRILHSDGTGWVAQASYTARNLWGVWGTGPDEVFAVGDAGTALRYDGGRWWPQATALPTNVSLQAVGGAAGGAVFAGGTQSTLQRYDRLAVVPQRLGAFADLYGVWVAGPNDIVAVGDLGRILYSSGSAWYAHASGTTANLRGVWGSSPTDIWARARGSVFLRYDGTDWSAAPAPCGGGSGYGLHGTSATDVWAGCGGGIYRFDGGAWTLSGSTPDFREVTAVWAVSPTRVYATSDGGAVTTFNGTSWSEVDTSALTGPNDRLTAVWASGTTNVWIAGRDYNGSTYQPLVAQYNGSSWTRRDPPGAELPRGMWGTASNNVYVVGDGGSSWRWDGAQWHPQQSATGTLHAVHGSGPDAIVAVGVDGKAYTYDAVGWSVVDEGAQMYALGGVGSTVVTSNGFSTRHFDGTTWTEYPYALAGYYGGIWGSSTSNIYAVGGSGTIARFDGSSWSGPMVSNTTQTLYGVWGSSASNIFAVGDNGTVVRYTGSSWSAPMTTNTTESLRGVWGSSSTNIFAVGDTGTVIRWNGSSWSAPMMTNTTQSLAGVWGSSATNVFAVGNGGVIRWDGGAWSSVLSGVVLDSVWGTGASDVYAVGNDTILRFDGTSWVAQSPVRGQIFSKVWAAAGAGAFAIGTDFGRGIVLQPNPDQWLDITRADTSSLYGVWGTGPTDLYALVHTRYPLYSATHLYHHDGFAWMRSPVLIGGFRNDLWGNGAGDLFVATSFGLSQIDSGGAVTQQAGATNAVWGAPTGEVFGVGNSGVIHRFDGSQWLREDDVTAGTLRGVWGSAANDVIAVGDAGVARRFDGAAWMPIDTGFAVNLDGVWVAASGNAYAVGESGTILFYDGATWTAMDGPLGGYLHDIWGAAEDDIVAVGEGGLVVHYNGHRWEPIDVDTFADLWRVWGSPDVGVFITGDSGTLLQLDYRGRF